MKYTVLELEDEVEGVKIKGELRYWSKDWEVRLLEPFEGVSYGGHLMFAASAKYVVKNSPNPTLRELNILEEAKEKLIKIYLDSK